MRSEEIAERLKQKPFVPFLLRMENGSIKEVHDPKRLFVFPNRLLLMTNDMVDGKPAPDRYDTIPLVTVLALEELGGKRSEEPVLMPPPTSPQPVPPGPSVTVTEPTPVTTLALEEALLPEEESPFVPKGEMPILRHSEAKSIPPLPPPPQPLLLGHVATDTAGESNERVRILCSYEVRTRVLRNQFVTITDAVDPETVFLARLLEGPFFHMEVGDASKIQLEAEIQGELDGANSRDTNNRPTPGSPVHELPSHVIKDMLGLDGDMLIGSLSGREDLPILLRSGSKEVLPRNLGIFGTVGAGKSNTVQVLLEEASARAWSVVVLDLEAEYTDMDKPSTQKSLFERLKRYGRQPQGLDDFHVYYPVSCASDCKNSQPFTLRMADYDSSVTAELLQTTLAERNALLDCIDHLMQKFRTTVQTRDEERLDELLDASPQAKLPYTLHNLRTRAVERSPKNSESLDYVGLASKLQLLIHSGAFDQQNMKGLDPDEMLRPGRVNIIDVSAANDTVKNLVTADLLRKAFAYKVRHPEAPPTMLVIEEAHSFMSRERVHTMQATLQMLRNVTRRGRKRWLSVAFVSQQPGHLPPEIFELCNTRIVHTLRSLHNLDTLMATTSDVTRELWARCPLLGTGEAIISTPQCRRSFVASIRPAMSSRRFTQ